MFTYTGPATARMVRLTNVHYDATEDDILQFFDSYTVIDQTRAIYPRVGINSSVYAMPSTTQDRNVVGTNFRNRHICGRRVNIMPTPSGNYVDMYRLFAYLYLANTTQDGFIRAGDNNTGSTPVGQPSTTPTLTESDFPVLGITSEQETLI